MNTEIIHQNQPSELAPMGNSLTMSSREIADLTGKRHAHVMRDIRAMLQELGEDQSKFGSIFLDSYGREQSQYELNKELTLTLLLGYDVKARLKVVRRWQELEQQQAPRLPSSYIEALETLVKTEKEKLAIAHERDEAIRTKAQIGSSREATAMATASAARRETERLKNELGKGTKQATITAVENATGEKLGRRAYIPMRKWCKEHGVTAADVKDDRYGSVKAWPAGAWLDCFDIDLQKLFGSEA